MKLTRISYMMVALVLALATFSSCKKEGQEYFRGVYGYTLGGTLTCRYQVPDYPKDEEPRYITEEYSVVSERGVMHLEPREGKMVLAMNPLSEGPTVFDVVVKGTEIILTPTRKYLTTSSNGILSTIPVTLSGNGYRAGDVLVLDMQCTSTEKDIVSSAITCVASIQK